MCGKFSQLSSWRDVVVFSAPLTLAGDEPVDVTTPMRFATIIRINAQGRREAVQMRWGFADRAAQNPSRPQHMHVRAETIDEKPTFAHAFRHGRGVLAVTSFNVGEELPNGKTKQWVITPKDEAPIAMAVICEEWVNGAERLWTFVQATTPANMLLSKVTDRMPAILRPEDWAAWLGETDASLAQVKALLRVYEDGGTWDLAPQTSKSAANQLDLF